MRQIHRRKIKQKRNDTYTWERPRKLSNLPRWPKFSAETPSSAKDKRGCWPEWFETSKGRKATHMEMEKQMFGKRIFAQPFRDSGRQKGL